MVRRLTALALALTLAAAPAAFAQGAGDDQYQDPFTEEPAQTTDESPSEDLDPLSQTPQGSGSDPLAPTTPSSGSAPSTTGTGSNQLPQTGSDARILALLGAALLFIGAGLRLRTTPERF